MVCCWIWQCTTASVCLNNECLLMINDDQNSGCQYGFNNTALVLLGQSAVKCGRFRSTCMSQHSQRSEWQNTGCHRKLEPYLFSSVLLLDAGLLSLCIQISGKCFPYVVKKFQVPLTTQKFVVWPWVILSQISRMSNQQDVPKKPHWLHSEYSSSYGCTVSQISVP